jgi:hypothetical protein
LSSYCAAIFPGTIKKPVFIEEKRIFSAWHGNCLRERDINKQGCQMHPFKSNHSEPTGTIMKRWSKLFALAGIVAACLMANESKAQNGGGGGGNGGGGGGGGNGGGGGRRQRGNFDPAQFRQMELDNAKDALSVTNDDEWNVISAAIGKVLDAQQDVRSSASFGMRGFRNRNNQNGGGGGGGGQGGGNANAGGGRRGGFGNFTPAPEVQALQDAIDSNASADEIKSKLTALRQVQKNSEAKLAGAQADLLKLLTPKQEASAVLLGLLK